jgi:hypothetical protein
MSLVVISAIFIMGFATTEVCWYCSNYVLKIISNCING